MLEALRQLFLNPQMLFGTALVGVPIVIYLINRQRFQRRRWAAMEFLLRAMKRNRRRIQLQNLLLLLVRCAIVLLLVLAAARPVSRLGVLSIGPDESHNWVLAVDTSYSMGYQEESRSAFEQARETISKMSDGLFKASDQVALMTFEAKPRVLLGPTRLTDEGRGKLRRELDDLRLTSGAADLGASFTVLDELCGKMKTEGGDPVPKRIVLFSDLQKKDWVGPEGPKPGLVESIGKIQKEGGSLAFARLFSRGSRPNMAIVDLTVSPALIAKDVWVEIRATAHNFGDEDFSNVDFTIRVDPDPAEKGAEPQVGEVIQLRRGGSEVRSLPYRFSTSGYHTVVAEIRSDGLLIDNRRFLTVKVEDDVKVLLVDGNPTSDVGERETFHLEAALRPEDDALGAVQGRFTPFRTQYATADQLGEVKWGDYAVAILAGVPELAPDHAAALKAHVKGGGALMVFLGPNVRPELYNQYFGPRPAEEGVEADPGLLPVKLEGIHGDPKYPVNLQVADAGHPIAEYFEARKDVTHLERPVISFGQYYRVSPMPDSSPGSRVCFRFTDTERSPAVFDNAYGLGRVLWVTSSASHKWNEFGSWPDFVVFLYESISYLVGFGLSSSNVTVGDSFRRTYSAAQYAPEVTLTEPETVDAGLDRTRGVQSTMKRVSGGTDFEVTHDDTALPGLYRLDMKRPNVPGTDTVEYFAANVDTRESDLTQMTRDDFQSSFDTLKYEEIDAAERIEEVKAEARRLGGKEHWKTLVSAVLCLLVVETVLGWLFGRRSRR